MVVKGMVASSVNSTDKGVSLKVMVRDLGDTFRCFIPKAEVSGESMLKMGDSVNVDFENFFTSNNEVRMRINHITLDTSLKSVK